MQRKIALFILITGVLIVANVVITGQLIETTSAESVHPPLTVVPQQDDGDAAEEPQYPSNGYCLLCHSQPGRTLTLPSGEVLSLEVDATTLANSVHGAGNPEGALLCADCHANHRYPHQLTTAPTLREYQLERYASCRTCHEDQYTRSQDSVHGDAIQAGQLDAATCVDCHGGHNIQPPAEPRQRISVTCGQCHGAIYAEYEDSIHGSALLAESNPDVPTCIDCHGVHDIGNPNAVEFRVRSPQVCADCHADEELMAKYDISTNVFDTYLNDFHGSTVALFEQQDPSVATNKAVCYDCHGVHNITPADNTKSQVAKENLLATCQQCHPNAAGNFPDAWVGHFQPTFEENPTLAVVNLFYRIIIPATLGGFAVLVVSDIFGRTRRRLFGGSHHEE